MQHRALMYVSADMDKSVPCYDKGFLSEISDTTRWKSYFRKFDFVVLEYQLNGLRSIVI